MKSKEPALRIGQAAAQLGITPHHLRELCKAGLMEAEQSPGGQWRGTSRIHQPRRTRAIVFWPNRAPR